MTTIVSQRKAGPWKRDVEKTKGTDSILCPFLESPGNLTGPKSHFEIKVSRKVGCVLTCNEVHFVYLTDNFTVQFKQLNGPGNYRELRETGPQWVERGTVSV